MVDLRLNTNMQNIIVNPLLREIHKRNRKSLLVRFPELANASNGEYLALIKYINHKPECFFSLNTFETFLIWIQDRDMESRFEFREYLNNNTVKLDQAFFHLKEVNNLSWHDYFEKLDEYEFIRFIDKEIHPSYLRLVEGVLEHFIHAVAYYSRISRGKGTDGLDIWSIVQELSFTSLSEVVKPYNHLVRNGIAHGGITFLQNMVKYRDKKGNEETYNDSEVIRLFDDLLDVCNGLALALSLFFLTHQKDGYNVPRELLLDELRESTRTLGGKFWDVHHRNLPILNN